jgi:tight adherence protein B
VNELLPKLAAGACVGAGVFIAAFGAARGETALGRQYRRYTRELDHCLKLTFTEGSGARIALVQLGVLVATLALLGALRPPLAYWSVLPLEAVAPSLYLARRRREHVRRVETQIDALIVALANALKTVPSASAALGQLVAVLPQPMRLEIERLLKEMRVGSTLEQALLSMSARLGSRDLDSALSAVLIGLQVGGNLPAVLESTAATIREMGRLEGVVRTKTSEARAQLWVLALFPFVIALGFHTIDPDYFVPLQTTFLGTLAAVGAGSFWALSLVTARKILKVDL